MNNKYEQLVEFIINDETSKARELFHQIVVEKSRDIYESLVDDEDLGEAMGGNEIEDLVDEVSLDEEGIAEDEDEFGAEDEFADDGAESEFDSEEDLGGDEFGDDVQDEASVEDRVVDLESALDELKAEFDALMGQEEGEGHDLGGEEFGGEEEQFGAEEGGEGEFELGGEMDEEMVREYVEKVTLPSNKSEGGEVGKGGSASINKQSTVAKPNNMGGTAGNFAKGTPNKNPTGPSSTQKPKGDLVSNPQNKPGANAGKSAFKTKQAPKAGEGQTTDGKVPVSAKSPYAK
jgi:hypothetical protein